MMTLLLHLALLVSLVQNVQPPAPKPAVIEGIVVAAEGGTPLQDAGVELSRVDPGGSAKFTVATRPDGTFSFQDVPAGDYRVAAARSGFLRAEYGERGSGGNGATITVAAGATVKEVRIPLIQTAAISGRVLDRNGRPVPNAQVQAFTLQAMGGVRLLETAKAVLTNDRGEYRLFWLAPGEYLVMAMPIRGAISDELIRTNGNGSTVMNSVPPAAGAPILPPAEQGPMPFFYGGTVDPDTATPIRVKSGDDLAGMDIPIRPVATFSVRGRILNPPASANTAAARPGGEPREEIVEIELEPRTPPTTRYRNSMPNGLVSVDPANWTFQIRGVLPGSYWAYARFRNLDPSQGRPLPVVQARVAVDVGGRDSEDVVISFSQGFDIPLRVVLENQTDGTAFAGLVDSLRLALSPGDGPGAGQNAEPVLGQPGSFIARNVSPGDYSVSMSTSGRSIAYYKTTRVEGIDTAGRFRIDRVPGRPIEVVFGLSTGTVSGTVTNNKLEGVSGATVVVYGPRGSFYATSARDGQFQIPSVPPGDFTVYAWEAIPLFTWQDPAVLQRAAGRGARVHLDDGSNVSVSVIALPAEVPGR
jgi:hypothetical protein